MFSMWAVRGELFTECVYNKLQLKVVPALSPLAKRHFTLPCRALYPENAMESLQVADKICQFDRIKTGHCGFYHCHLLPNYAIKSRYSFHTPR